MPTSRYSWLKQEQAKERKDENNQLEQMRRNMAVIGGDDSFANRYGGKRLGNTGYGEDGVLQPSMPTQIVGTGAGPQMLHEGEDVRVMPNGAIQVNPASQSTPQTQLAGMERPSGMPGMAMGGRIELKNLANRVSGVGAAVGNMLTAMRSNPAGLETPLTNLPLTPRPVASNPTDAAGNQIGSGGPATAFVAPLDQIGGATVRPPEAPDTTSDNYLLTADDNSLSPEQLARKQWLQNESGARWAAAAPTPKMDAAGNILGQNVPTAPDAADVPPVTPNPPPTLGTQAGTYWGRGMQRLERTAEGQDPFAERIRLAEQGRFAAEEQAARGSQAQEAAQQGLTGTEFLTEKAMLGQQIGSKENELMLGLRKQEQANALAAAGQIPGEARSMMAEQLAQDKFGYQRATDAMSALIASGDLDGAANLFAATYGTNMDVTRLKTEQGRQDFASGMENISKYIASGLTYDQALSAMKSDGTFEMLGLDDASTKNLYETLQLGSDPVYRAMNALSDETLATIFPDLSPAEARATIGKMNLLGIGTLNPDGTFSIDYGMLADIFGEEGVSALIGGGAGETPPQPEAESFDTFTGTIPTGEEGDWNYQRWVREGRPTSFDNWLLESAGGDENSEQLSTLYASTGGNLASADLNTINMVANAMRSGNESVTNNFGISNDALEQAIVQAAVTGNQQYLKTQSFQDLENMTGKVVAFTPEQYAKFVLGDDATSEQISTFTQQWNDEFGSGDITFVIDRVVYRPGEPMHVTIRNPVTGTIKNVDFKDDPDDPRAL